MRQIKEILRLKFQHQLSIREIARSCAVATSTVGDYLKRAEVAGLSWPELAFARGVDRGADFGASAGSFRSLP